MKIPALKPLQEKLVKSEPVQLGLNWSKRHSLPGFFKVPIFDVMVFLFNEIKRFDLITRANSIAFSFFLALFPSIIVVFTLVPYFSEYILSFFGFTTTGFLNILHNEIRQILPGDQGVGVQLFEMIEDLATKERADVLSIGFILAIFFSSNGMISMMRSFEKSHLQAFKKRHPLKKRIIAILLTLQLGLLLVGSVVLIILGNYIIGFLATYVKSAGFSTIGLYFIKWAAILLLIYGGIGIIYRYGMATHVKFSIVSPGATLATILSILASMIFSAYVDNFGAYSRIYGPIGTIIVSMLWIQLNALALLIGFELNAAIAAQRDITVDIGGGEED